MQPNFQDFLYKSIPLSKHMQIQVLKLTEGEAQVLCPISANYNHMNTAFGGSISAGLLLACYSKSSKEKKQSKD